MSDGNDSYSSARITAAELAAVEQRLREAAQFARIEGTKRHDLRLLCAGLDLAGACSALNLAARRGYHLADPHLDPVLPTPERH